MTLPQKYSLFGLVSLALLAPASAQTQSSTPVIGYYKFNIPAGDSAWTCGFVTKTLFQGQSVNVQNNTPSAGKATITFSGTSWAVNDFNSSGSPLKSSHYLELLDAGSSQGRIVDIISNNQTAIVVNGTLPIALQQSVAIRKHATLSTIFPEGGGTDPNNGKGLVREADYITLYFSDGSLEQYIFNPNNTWSTTGGVPANDVVVYPCQGFQVTCGGATELTIGGGEVSYVKSTPTQIPLYVTGVNLVGLLNPVVAPSPGAATTASERSSLQQYGFQSISNVLAEADTFTLFSLDGSFSQSPYFVAPSLTGMIDAGSVSANSVTVQNGSAAYIIPNADLTWTAPVLHPH